MSTALSDLRRTRRSRRLGDTEWFDLAYRVYLAAFFGGGAIIMASDQVGDRPLNKAGVADVFHYGPGILGLAAAIAVAIGLIGGAEGGPLSIESADVRYLLMAPISRATVLRRPFVQRLRSELFIVALVCGSAGLLAAQRLPGSAPAWVLGGAIFGACIAALHVSSATISHALRVPKFGATILGTIAIATQASSVVRSHTHRTSSVLLRTGPFNCFGSLALWGGHQFDKFNANDAASFAISLIVTVVVVAAALLVVGRLRIEHLARRGPLVSQLRFAVTTQDLRTVVLLRRQLRQEQPRPRPWIRLAPRNGGASAAAMRRSVRSMLRMPFNRAVRLSALAGAAGLAAGAAARGTTPAVLATGFALFVMGLDLIEPLSQEVDHPDLTDGLPAQSGWLHVRLLFGPALFSVPLAAIGAASFSVVVPAAIGPAFALAVPMTLIGMGGSIVNVFQGTAQSSGSDALMMPPEVAGFGNVIKAVIPLAVSSVGTVAILVVRELPTVGTVIRAWFALLLIDVALYAWVLRRSDLQTGWQNMKIEAAGQAKN